MRTRKILVGISAICLIIIGLLLIVLPWSIEEKTLLCQYSLILVTGAGFIIAIYQLNLSYADIRKKSKDYLDLKMRINSSENVFSIKTQVINKSGEEKLIDFAFLVVSDQNRDFGDELMNIVRDNNWPIEIEFTNDLIKLKYYIQEAFHYNNSVLIIPLSFFYKENIGIGNESPSYTYSFDNGAVHLNAGIYSVRFFVFPKQNSKEHVYHRCTVESLIV
jgi:hypothetical protein